MNHINDDQEKESRKYFIPVDGKYYETTKEVYKVYYQMDRRERYLEERDIKKGVQTFSDISNSIYSADEIIADVNVDVCGTAISNILFETVLEALSILTEEENWLIQELFFNGKTEREVALELNLSKTALHYRKEKVIKKIKENLNI